MWEAKTCVTRFGDDGMIFDWQSHGEYLSRELAVMVAKKATRDAVTHESYYRSIEGYVQSNEMRALPVYDPQTLRLTQRNLKVSRFDSMARDKGIRYYM